MEGDNVRQDQGEWDELVEKTRSGTSGATSDVIRPPGTTRTKAGHEKREGEGRRAARLTTVAEG